RRAPPGEGLEYADDQARRLPATARRPAGRRPWERAGAGRSAEGGTRPRHRASPQDRRERRHRRVRDADELDRDERRGRTGRLGRPARGRARPCNWDGHAGSPSGAPRGFAIPIRQALLYAHTIMKGKSSSTIHVGPTAFLGVVLKDVSGGTKIQQILPNLPAEAAGLVVGDVITSLNGATISSMADMRKALLSLAVGTAVSIGWTDTTGAAQTGTITPASGPPQ